MLVHVDLCSGIGGFTLACEWAGIETIGFVEIDKYCQKVLRKHWPGVPIVGDIRDVEKIKEIVANATSGRSEAGAVINREASQDGRFDVIGYSETRLGTRRNTESPAILVTAGFPCQPFSVAGKRQGEGDDRYLWPETLAVIEAIKPTWVLLENVTGITGILESASASELAPKALKAVYDRDLRFENEYTKHHKISALLKNIQERILHKVIGDLEKAGYEVPRTRQGEPIVLCVPACAVNAWHRRDRIWILAYSLNDSNRRGRGQDTEANSLQGINRQAVCSRGISRTSDVANSLSTEGGGERGRLTGRAKDKERRATEEGGATLCPRAEAPLPSQSRQAGDIVPDTGHLQHRGRDTIRCSIRKDDRPQGKDAGGGKSGQGQARERTQHDPSDGGTDVADSKSGQSREQTEPEGREDSGGGSKKVSIADTTGNNRGAIKRPEQSQGNTSGKTVRDPCWWAVEPELGRVAHGIPDRVDRLKCLGNAIVPQVAYEIIKVIVSIENG